MEQFKVILEQLHIEPGALLVNAIGFVLLFLLLRKYAFGPIAEIIHSREDKITADVKQAQESRKEAEAHLQELQQQREGMLAAAGQEAEELRREGRTQGETLVEQARRQARERELQADKRIAGEEDQARGELAGEVTGLAVELSRRLLQQSLDEDRHAALMDEFIAEVERLAGQSSNTIT